MVSDTKPLISNAGSSRNSLKPISKTEAIDFYHAHGIAKWKNTLCLSHEHYASLISKIRGNFYPDATDEGEETLTDLITGKRQPDGIWPELFFTTDMAIVGFGLDYSESDIWWLLALRASIFAPCHDFSDYENTITYYHAEIESTPSSRESAHLQAIESLGVQIRPERAEDYPDAYELIAKDIRKEWQTQDV